MPEAGIDKDEIDRIWRHKEESISHFFNFANFFLLSESVLLAVVGVLINKNDMSDSIALSITILGLIFSILWMYIQAKQRFIVENLKTDCETFLPRYKEHREKRKNSFFRISNGLILAYILPFLFISVWAVILFVVLK